MTTTTTPTQDVEALEQSLHALEETYGIPVGNDHHTLLNNLFAKYRDQLGVDPGYTTGGGVQKTPNA